MPSPHLGRPTKSTLQVPFQNVPLNTSDSKQHKTLDAEPSQQPGSNEKCRTTSQKAESICIGHCHNRHVFQQQLIEKQKKKLREQQKTILELKESQKLAKAQWATERALAATDAQSHQLSKPRGEEGPKYVHCVRTLFGLTIRDFSLYGKGAPELCPASGSVISPFLLLCTLKGSKEALCVVVGTNRYLKQVPAYAGPLIQLAFVL